MPPENDRKQGASEPGHMPEQPTQRERFKDPDTLKRSRAEESVGQRETTQNVEKKDRHDPPDRKAGH
jgi:hypothetical protein